MNSHRKPWWRLLGLLVGLTSLSFLSAVLFAAVLTAFVLIGGGCVKGHRDLPVGGQFVSLSVAT